MIYLVYTIHIIVCIFLILVVLLQQGKGADLSVFGGGSTQTVFGARGAATFLHKMTVGGFIAFTLTTISIGLLSGSASSSVFRDADLPTVVEEEVADPLEEVAPITIPDDDGVPAAEDADVDLGGSGGDAGEDDGGS